MADVNNRGVRIHYEVTGSGAPLVLQHGWTNSLEYWRDFGFVEGLADDYQLILIDARGHGASDIPTNAEAYDTKTMAGDILAVLDDLGVEKTHFFGYSMGGRIGFDLAASSPERLRSMIIGGAHPYAVNFSRARENIRNGTAAIAAGWEAAHAPLSDKAKQALLNHDLMPLRACMSHDRQDISSSLSAIPCLTFVGESDFFYKDMKAWADSASHVSFFSLPELNHLQAWARSDLTLPRIKEFLASVSKTID